MSDRPKTSSADEWALWLDEWKGANTAFLAVQIAEAIEEQRADLLPVVKPLVWEETHNGVWCARYRAGHFYECLNMGADRWVVYETIHGTSRQIDTWSDLEAALTAAQADYEARIRASLDMIDPAALVAGAYEAAAMEFDGWDNVPVQMTYDEARCRIRDLTPADAQAALDAAIAKAVNEKLEEVAAKAAEWAMKNPDENMILAVFADEILAMKEPE